MELSERIGWMLLGMGIGFVLGLIVAHLRTIEEKVDSVDEHITNKRNERGFTDIPAVASLMYLLVLVIVVWSVIQAARATHESDKAQRELKRTVSCIERYNVRQGDALTSRDKAIRAGTQSEIALWTKYAELYALAKEDPSKVPELNEALNRAVLSHRDALEETQGTREENPYPNPDILQDCKENTR